MFARSIPRATSRLIRFAQCEARPHFQTFARAPATPWSHVQKPLGRRYASSIRELLSKESIKKEYRKNPFLMTFVLGVIAFASGIFVFYIPYHYQRFVIKPFVKYPESVAVKLRRAVFYSREENLDLREAMRYFQKALHAANQEGMDPISDEILGVKWMIASIFDKHYHYATAIDVLEYMRGDCKLWMQEFSENHITDGNRTRVKRNMITISLKLAEIYAVKYVNDPEMAEKRFVEAVEWALGEKQRREREGVKEGEGDWMTDEEVGATLEALGSHYEKFDSHYLATPLFVQALTLCPPKSCHGVVLMNNISTCLAQQTPPPPSSNAVSMSPSPSSFPVTQPPPRAVLLDQARQWATKAIALSAEIPRSERTEECDTGCAVATHNLGEFFEMEGKIEEARRKYDEALSLSKNLRFAEGQSNARAGLKRLKELESKE